MDDFEINDNYEICGEDASHISKSLRMKSGECVTICSKGKTDYLCEIVSVSSASVSLKIVESSPNKTEPKVKINLFQCIPKADKFETIIQKSVELGVHSITPVLSSRCISRPNSKSMEKKILRYQKIAHHAAEQSGRGIVPQIQPMISFESAVSSSENILLFYEKSTQKLSSTNIEYDNGINIFIGSEGGFSKQEVEIAKQNGAQILSLGARIMRTETAPIAALAAIMYKFGEM